LASDTAPSGFCAIMHSILEQLGIRVAESQGTMRKVQPCGHVTEAHGFCFASDPSESPALQGQVPSHAEHDDLRVKVPPLEKILWRSRLDHPGRYGGVPVFSSVCTRTHLSLTAEF
jgi:hypothetical protein